MKKRTTKFISLLMALGMTFGMTLGATSCGGGKGNSDSEQTLDIYLLVRGYGRKWLDSTIERFKKTDWVKEKYPNLVVNADEFDSIDGTAGNKLQAGASINKFDLMFSVNMQNYENTGLIADLTDIVYNTEVPGETGVKVIDKVPQRVLDTIKNSKDDKYYVSSYVQGMFGMLYNADLLEQMQLEVPLTTDQFLSTAGTITTKGYKDGYGNTCKDVLMHYAGDNYWARAFDIWWAQYEGMQGYKDYFDGYNATEEVTGSMSVLDQKGRLESLEVIEDILTSYNNGTKYTGFKQTQTAFLSGEGVFHFNGDYFATEMQTEIDYLKNSENIDFDIKFMKMPVVSAIIDKMTTITTDAQLQTVIKEVDANKAYDESTAKTNGVSKADYDKVVEARSIGVYSAANVQSAVIPSYAKGKDVAADFLRFMYTDESIRDFTISSGGVLFPSTYDIANDTEIVNSLNGIQKSKLDIFRGTSNVPCKYFPAEGGTYLGKGGLTALYFSGKFEVYFAQGLAANTAASILAAEKEHWSGAWGQMVATANGK